MADKIRMLDSTVRNLVDIMAGLSESIDPTDLGELAKIHENALKINDTMTKENEPALVAFRTFCTGIEQRAENIILECLPDLSLGLKQMALAIGRLHDVLQISDALPDEALFKECLGILDGTAASEPAATKKTAINPPETTAPAEPSATARNDEAKNVPAPSETVAASPEKTDSPVAAEQPATSKIDLELKEYKQEPLILANQEFEYVQSFLTESQEHIEAIETAMLELEQQPGNLDKINELFRPFHTIKGMAGFLNLRDIQAVTHEVETLLDLGRKGKLEITSPVIDLVFETLDVLKVQISAIGHYIEQPNNQPIPQPPITELRRRLNLAARGIFSPAVLVPADHATKKKLIGEILAESGCVSPELIEFALAQQKAAGDNKPIGQILSSMGVVQAKDVSKALREQQNELHETVVRVDTVKLDNLVNMVGELVIIQTQVEQNSVLKQNPQLNRLVEQVSKITRDVQEAAMSMRMVPLTQTFHKMGRVIRDLSKKVDKKINFEMEGEDTELDKNVIQELSDPLMHMIRNAVDHGVESTDKRIAAGKPEAGTVKLKAYHQGGNIVIEISDDGKGLDKDVLIRKGIEKGLVSPDSPLTEQQAFGLIMAPGFSTAEKVTDISGRGVGMDVVKKNIDKMRGKVEIRSVKGEGTTFTIKLPLTLAVIDGMIVRVGSQKFVLPTLSIIQALSPTAEQIKTVQERGHVLNLRGQLYPLINLGEMFGFSDSIKDATQGMIVIAQVEDQQIGLILDELLGQQQVVIKTLGDRFKSITGITGGAILGDGTIGLILEPAGLLALNERVAAA
jgi:two-component system chemotaxis sensor kinase CheA